MTSLSGSGLVAQLKSGKFQPCFSMVANHIDSNPEDQEGIAKFMSAINVFTFNNNTTAKEEMGDNGIKDLADVTAKAFRALAKIKPLTKTVLEKAMQVIDYVIVKFLLKYALWAPLDLVLEDCKDFLLAEGNQAAAGFCKDMQKFSEVLQKTTNCQPERILRSKWLQQTHFRVKQLGLYCCFFDVHMIRVQAGEQVEKVFPEVAEVISLCSVVIKALYNEHVANKTTLATLPNLIEHLVNKLNRLGWIWGMFEPEKKSALKLLKLSSDHITWIGTHFPKYAMSGLVMNAYLLRVEMNKSLKNSKQVEAILNDGIKTVLKLKALKGGGGKKPDVLCELLQIRFIFLLLLKDRDEMKLKIEEASQKRAQVKKALKEKPEASSNVEPSGDVVNTEEAEEINDINPYRTGISLDNDEIIYNRLRTILQVLKALVSVQWDEGPSPVQDSVLSAVFVHQTLMAAAEMAKLLGHESMTKEIYRHTLTVMTTLKYQEGVVQSISELIILERTLKEEWKETVQTCLSDMKPDAASLRIPIALAWLSFHQGKLSHALHLASKVQAANIKLKKSTMGYKVGAQACLLMGLCRSSPATAGVTVVGRKSVTEGSAQDLILEAFRNAARGVERSGVQGMEYINLNLINVYLEVMCWRTQFYRWQGLPRDLSLYTMVRLQTAEEKATSIRAMDAMLDMAMVELLFDSPDSCASKLAGIDFLIGHVFQGPDEVKSRPKKLTADAATVASSASPNLHRPTFSLPGFLLCEDGSVEHGYVWTQKHFLKLAVKYLNTRGVCHHQKGDLEAAATYFEGVQNMLRTVQRRAEELEDSPELKVDILVVLVDALQWQIECYSRDRYFSKCDELVQKQRDILSKLPHHFHRCHPQISYLLCDQDLALKNVERLDVSGLEGRLGSLALSPSPSKQPLKETSNMVTPVVRPKRNLPRKPVKKLLHPDY